MICFYIHGCSPVDVHIEMFAGKLGQSPAAPFQFAHTSSLWLPMHMQLAGLSVAGLPQGQTGRHRTGA